MGAEVTGKVVGIADGDTITVLDNNKKQYKIRLQGIDSPESGQPFSQNAKENLSDLIFGKTVKVLIYKKDRYNRSLGTVYLDGKDINLEQIKAGYAWHYKKYQSDQNQSEREQYSTAETSARAGRIGLWRDAAPVVPEEWRSWKA
ncbi:MAG TPA: thermonuclease family protein [Pyrinomonadaceae bacterium]|nr:thermonuclease family protein [Pyrinomonadaceae bacterium]